jgi:uncharacterized protein (DUF58 family)
MYSRLLYALGLAMGASYLWSAQGIRNLELLGKRSSLRLQVGDTVEEQLTLRNTSRFTKPWLEVRDLTTLPGLQPGRILRIGGHESRTWGQRLTARRRGVYTLGPLEVRSPDPFGLFVHRRHLLGTHAVIVYPATQDIPILRLPLVGQTGEGSHQQHAALPSPHASTVREYTPTDGFNRIHWPTTARMGKLMVKQFDEGAGNTLWLLVDLYHGAQFGSGDAVTDEYSVMVAASVAKRYLQLRIPVGLVAYGHEAVSVTANKGVDQLPRLLGALASVKAEGEIPLTDALLKRQGDFQGLNTLMIITASADPSWAIAVQPLIQKGTRIVAVIVDPNSFGEAASLGPLLDGLAMSGVTSFVVRHGEPLATGLAHPYEAGVAGVPARRKIGSLE